MSPVLQLRELGKSFGGFWALRNVSIDFTQGEVHALVGENGAGKSTLIKLIAARPSSKRGDPGLAPSALNFSLKTPRDALKQGIGVVHQELDLFDNLTVAENIALGIDDTGLVKIIQSDDGRDKRAKRSMIFKSGIYRPMRASELYRVPTNN